MRLLLAFLAVSAAFAQPPESVCQILELARDGQLVTVRGEYFHSIEGTILREPGLIEEPCPSHRGFARPSVLPAYRASDAGIRLSNVEQMQLYAKMHRPSGGIVTVKAVFIRPWWSFLIHQKADGQYGTFFLWDLWMEPRKWWKPYWPGLAITGGID